MKESVRILEMLDINNEATYQEVTNKFEEARDELEKRKKKSTNIRIEINFQNEILDLEDAYIEYQNYKNEELRRSLKQPSH